MARKIYLVMALVLSTSMTGCGAIMSSAGPKDAPILVAASPSGISSLYLASNEMNVRDCCDAPATRARRVLRASSLFLAIVRSIASSP